METNVMDPNILDSNIMDFDTNWIDEFVSDDEAYKHFYQFKKYV